MALRRAAFLLGPKGLQPFTNFAPLGSQALNHLTLGLDKQDEQDSQQQQGSSRRPIDLKPFFRTFATSTAIQPYKKDLATSVVSQLSASPTHKIEYNERNHKRLPVGTEGRSYKYFILTGTRALWAVSLRTALVTLLWSFSPAADTLAAASLEVDISKIPEGQQATVLWRGKAVFIKHRTDEEIAIANSYSMKELKDPQPDADRVVDPKWLIVVGVCTHLGCVPIAGAGNYPSGWFCPCHGSHYDVSGRVREGPAPLNLEIPPYKFVDEKTVVIG